MNVYLRQFSRLRSHKTVELMMEGSESVQIITDPEHCSTYSYVDPESL